MTDDIRKSIHSYYDVYFGIGAIYERFAKAHDITSTAMFVLFMVKEFSSACTQRFICDKLMYPKQTVNTILDAFEKQGYITKQIAPTDKRSKYILLTDAGHAYADRMIYDMQQLEETAFTGMRTDQRHGMRDGEQAFLEQLSRAMDTFTKGEQTT